MIFINWFLSKLTKVVFLIYNMLELIGGLIMLRTIVKSIRIANDMSTKEVAQGMGVRQSFVSDLENGTRNITMGSLSKMAEVYDIPVSQIMLFDEKQEEQNLNYRQTLLMVLKYYEYEKDKSVDKPKEFVR